MSRWGFRSLAALLGLGLLAGGWLVLNSYVGGSAIQQISCAEWLADPREGEFELGECQVDAGRSGLYGGEVVVPVVRDNAGPRLYAFTSDPVITAAADRVHQDQDPEEHARTLERFASELRPVRPLRGQIVRASNWPDVTYVEDEFDRRYERERDYILRYEVPHQTPVARSFGVVTMLFCGPLFLFLFFAQRRWLARADEVRRRHSGSTKPAVF